MSSQHEFLPETFILWKCLGSRFEQRNRLRVLAGFEQPLACLSDSLGCHARWVVFGTGFIERESLGFSNTAICIGRGRPMRQAGRPRYVQPSRKSHFPSANSLDFFFYLLLQRFLDV